MDEVGETRTALHGQSYEERGREGGIDEEGRRGSSLVVVTVVPVVVVAVVSAVVAEAEVVRRALLDVGGLGKVLSVVLDCEREGKVSSRRGREEEERRGTDCRDASSRGGGSLGRWRETGQFSEEERKSKGRRRERTVAVVVPVAVIVVSSVVCSTK